MKQSGKKRVFRSLFQLYHSHTTAPPSQNPLGHAAGSFSRNKQAPVVNIRPKSVPNGQEIGQNTRTFHPHTLDNALPDCFNFFLEHHRDYVFSKSLTKAVYAFLVKR